MTELLIQLAPGDIKRITKYLDIGEGEVDDILMEICAQAEKQKEED